MHLVYLDESGNTGMNLKDPQQPVFVLCAMIVNEACWQALEADLAAEVRSHVPAAMELGQEIHSNDLRRRNGPFEDLSVTQRIAFRAAWFDVASKHGVRFVYRSIVKSRLAAWVEKTLGPGVGLNPHRPAFPLVARVVNEFMAGLKPAALGIFISDENHEIVTDVEQTIKLLRVSDGSLRLGQIVEKGFFVESHQSLPLQLTDMAAMAMR